MAIRNLTADLNNVSKLADQPVENAEELKETFDEAGNQIKAYINDILIPDLIDTFLSKLGGTVSGNLKVTGATECNGSSTVKGSSTVEGLTTLKGGLSVNTSGNSATGIELYGEKPFFDFHYNNTALDWTARIMESMLGRLSLIGANGVDFKTTYTASENDIFAQIYKSGNTVIFGGLNDGVAFRSKSNLSTSIPIQASRFVTSSSKRYKENIRQMTDDEAEKILDINVVKFDYKNKDNGTNVGGAIAEEVEKVIPEVITYTQLNGEKVPDGIDYTKLVPYLIKEIQILKQEIETLKK